MVTNVKYPTARHDMILYLKDLSDFEMQKREWVNSKYKHSFSDDMFNCIDMLLNEREFDDWYPEDGAIGDILYNVTEGHLIKRVATLLNQVELDKPDSYYLSLPLWQEVVVAAKEAYDYIMTYEDMDDLLRQCQEE